MAYNVTIDLVGEPCRWGVAITVTSLGLAVHYLISEGERYTRPQWHNFSKLRDGDRFEVYVDSESYIEKKGSNYILAVGSIGSRGGGHSEISVPSDKLLPGIEAAVNGAKKYGYKFARSR